MQKKVNGKILSVTADLLVRLGSVILEGNPVTKLMGVYLLMALSLLVACGGAPRPARVFFNAHADSLPIAVSFGQADTITGRWTGSASAGSTGLLTMTIDLRSDGTGLAQGIMDVPFSQHGESGRVQGVFTAPVYVTPSGKSEISTWFEAMHLNSLREKPFRVGVEAAISDSGILHGYLKSGYASDSHEFAIALASSWR